MPGQDILLSIGIDITSLRTAKEQINTELKSLVGELPIFADTKQFTEAQKMTRALKTEFSKLGTAIGKGNIDTYFTSIKKGATDASRATQAFKKDIADVNNAVGKTGGATRFTDAFVPDAIEVEAATESVDKLAQTTKFYELQTKALGPSIAFVTGEMRVYHREMSTGTILTEEQTKRLAVLEAQQRKMAEAQKAQSQSLMHGINIPRLLLWGVGWTAVYGAMRKVSDIVGQVISDTRELNLSIQEMRINSGQNTKEFARDWEILREKIAESARTSTIGVKELAKSAASLNFEGITDPSIIAAGVEVIKDLTNITKATSGKDVVDALAESYSAFGDKLAGTYTEVEKMYKIGSLLNELFVKGHIDPATYAQMMSRVGLAAQSTLPNLESLIALLLQMDSGFKGNRAGAMDLTETLIALTNNKDKLADTFGILFKKGESSDALAVLNKLRESFGSVLDDVNIEKLESAGFSPKAIHAFSLILKNYDAVNQAIEKNTNLTYENVAAHSEVIANANIYAKAAREFGHLLWELSGGAAELGKGMLNDIKNGLNATREAIDALRGKKKKVFGYPDKLPEDPMQRLIADIVKAEMAKGPKAEQIKQVEKLTAINKEATKSANELAVAQKAALVVDEEKEKRKKEKEGFGNINKQLIFAKQQLYIDQLQTLNANERVISSERVYDAQLKIAYLSKDEVIRAELLKTLSELRNADEFTIYKTLLDFGINRTKIEEYLLTLTKENYAIISKMNQEIAEMAGQLQSATANFANDLMAGTGDIKAFMDNIVGVYRQTFSQQITQMFAESTGIFGNMATAFMGPLQKAHYEGITAAAPLIKQAHIDGIQQGMANAQGTGGGEGGIGAEGGGKGGGAGGLFAAGGLLGGLFGGGKSGQYSASTANTGGNIVAYRKDASGNMVPVTAGQTANASIKGGAGGPGGYGTGGTKAGAGTGQGFMAGAGQAMGVAGGLYSGYQGIQAQKNASSPAQGALGGAMSGAMAGSMFGPVGMAVGAVVGGVMGFMNAKKGAAGDAPQAQSYRIESAIKLSNNHLQAISRNTSSLNRNMEKYLSIAPQSSFMAEGNPIESRFMRDKLMA